MTKQEQELLAEWTKNHGATPERIAQMTLTKEDIEDIVERCKDLMFKEVCDREGLESGDFSPDQTCELYDCQETLVKLLRAFAMQNKLDTDIISHKSFPEEK